MSRIGFSFSGYIIGAKIETVVVTETGEVLDVREIDPGMVATKLNSGIWTITLGNYLYNANQDSVIDMFDFDVELQPPGR